MKRNYHKMKEIFQKLREQKHQGDAELFALPYTKHTKDMNMRLSKQFIDYTYPESEVIDLKTRKKEKFDNVAEYYRQLDKLAAEMGR